MNELFLTEDDVGTLTGVKKGAFGVSKYKRQADQLKRMGIPHWTNIQGRPIV